MAATTAVSTLLQRRGVRQFVKFCIIGFTSMLLDVGISGFLTFHSHWLWWVARTLSFAIAVTNGYIWNSVWTFRGLGTGGHHEKYARFVVVNIVGYVLNISLMKLVFLAFTGELVQHSPPSRVHWAIATAVAVVCVSVWNFAASKYWTFRQSASAAPAE